MTIIYVLAYLTSMIGLLAWFLFKGNRNRSLLMSKLFLGGFLIYLVALTFAPGALPGKLFVLFRDFIFLALVALAFDRIQHNKILLVGFALLLGIFFQAYYLSVLWSSFGQAFNLNQYPIEQEGELLMHIPDGVVPIGLQTVLDKYEVGVTQAFQPTGSDLTTLDDYFLVDIPERKYIQDEMVYAEIAKLGLKGLVLEWNDLITVDLPEERAIARSGKKVSNDPLVDQQWWIKAMDIERLHRVLKSHPVAARQAKIAILDTGIDAGHEDLSAIYVSTDRRYDKDIHGHGTICAGVVGGITGNNKGIASASIPSNPLQVTGITVINNRGHGSQQAIINGMIRAADEGVDVISLSLGSRSNDRIQAAYGDAVTYCQNKGVIVVASAGNSSENASNFAPAGVEGVIAIGASNEKGGIASFSNTIEDVDMGLFAPGTHIFSTRKNNQYGAHSGTSFSGPIVASVIGIMRSYKPDLTSAEAYSILERTGVDMPDASGKLIRPALAVEHLLHQEL